MPESALTAPKEKKLTGRQWFESGRAVFLILANYLAQTRDKDLLAISFFQTNTTVVNYLSLCHFQRGTVVAADQESEEEDDEDIDFEDEDFEGKKWSFSLVRCHSINKQWFSRIIFVCLIQMMKKTCLSTIWRRNLIRPLPHHGHEAKEPYIMIIGARSWIEFMMQETDLTLRSIHSPYPQFSKL